MVTTAHEILILCALRIDGRGIDWNLIAREAQKEPSLQSLLRAIVIEQSKAGTQARELLSRVTDDDWQAAGERVSREIDAADEVGARLVTVLDPDYPANLRLIPNLPPFLFILGDLRPEDAHAVAVVGTRRPSEDGLRRAGRMARLLADRGVTVVSGLAAGIDTAAHAAALDNGGRTVAVLGTGITQTYPKSNADLAQRITGNGALVSQFWPTTGPTSYTFPRRNVVTSGIGQGTVVIEASSTSGAKMQARIALDHHKRVFLVRSLVTSQPWARKYLERGAVEVDHVDDVVDRLAPADRVTAAGEQRQLAFDLF